MNYIRLNNKIEVDSPAKQCSDLNNFNKNILGQLVLEI